MQCPVYSQCLSGVNLDAPVEEGGGVNAGNTMEPSNNASVVAQRKHLDSVLNWKKKWNNALQLDLIQSFMLCLID